MLGFKGPRKMHVVIPEVSAETRQPFVIQPTPEHKEGIVEKFKKGSLDQLMTLQNKQPVWNDGTAPFPARIPCVFRPRPGREKATLTHCCLRHPTETQSYVLNFRGRVTKPSVKNFQVVQERNCRLFAGLCCRHPPLCFEHSTPWPPLPPTAQWSIL